MSSRLLAGCQDQHGTHTAPQLPSVHLFAGYRYAVFLRADQVRAYDAVAAASGATSSATATATVADAALSTAAAAATATTSVSSFASARCVLLLCRRRRARHRRSRGCLTASCKRASLDSPDEETSYVFEAFVGL